MRALTVRQPWAWAIIHGGKDVENRTRNIAGAYRGPVAIHAAMRDSATAPSAVEIAWHLWWGNEQANGREPGGQRGHVIGVVDLVDEHHPAERWFDCTNSAPCSPWAMPGHHHLVLANPRPLPRPIPAKGRLGLWRPGDTLEAAIREQLGEAS